MIEFKVAANAGAENRPTARIHNEECAGLNLIHHTSNRKGFGSGSLCPPAAIGTDAVAVVVAPLPYKNNNSARAEYVFPLSLSSSSSDRIKYGYGVAAIASSASSTNY